MTPPSQHLATVLVDQLIAQGMTDLVLAPGSRSAPIAYAAWQRRDRLRLHVRIDERGAGFLALGLARGTGRPVGVVTTSGTAAANLLPAVLEAHHSRIPLVAITADRPATMLHTGANQTTDQLALFGRHVRTDARLTATEDAPRAWAFQVARALSAATGRRGATPGPVHLEVAFVDPLVPESVPEVVPGVTEAPASSITAADLGEWPAIPAPTQIPPDPGTVVVAGDLPPVRGRQVAERAAAARVPLLAEPSSNARHGATAIQTYRLLLDTALGERISRVVMVGRPTLSRPVQRLLARRDVDLTVVDPSSEWIDPGLNAARVVGDFSLSATDPGLLEQWQRADRRLGERLAAEPDHGPGGVAPLHLARAVVAHATGVLAHGASNPIRDVDLVDFASGQAMVEHHANRGLAGIDGFVSTAYGIALADPERDTTALCGDLTFLHDSTGLVVGPDEPRPSALRYVVANDDGGSIFATLEHGRPERAATFERLFGTAHHADLAALCAASGTSHVRVERADQLVEVLTAPINGVEVIEVRVDRTDRPGQAARWQRLAADSVD